MYMDVHELNRDQLDYLKQDLLTQRMIENGECPSYGELADASETISDDEVFESYADVLFVEEDFMI